MRNRFLTCVASLGFVLAVPAWALPSWKTHLVDLQGSTTGFFSVVFLSSGPSPLFVYANSQWRTGTPAISSWDGRRFVITEVAALPARSDVSMAMGPDGVLRLAYPGLGTNGGWWYGEWRSGQLSAEQILSGDGRESAVKLAVNRSGEVSVAVINNIYSPYYSRLLMRVPGGSWDVHDFTPMGGYSRGQRLWPAVSSGYVGYYRVTASTGINYLVASSPSWQGVAVDTFTLQSATDWDSALLVDVANVPHVFYSYEEPAPGGLVWRHVVKHAWKVDDAWQKESVHTWDGAQASIRMAPSEGGDGALRLIVSWKDLEAWPFTSTNAKGQWVCTKSTTTGTWTCEPVEVPEASVTAMSPAVVDSSGTIHALYVTSKGEIKYASTRALEDTTLLSIVAKKSDALVAANNYFNPTAAGSNYTRLYYKVATPGRVRVKVYTTDGVLVGTLVDEDKAAAGTFAADWAGKDETGQVVGTGLYVAELEAPGVREVKKIVVVK